MVLFPILLGNIHQRELGCLKGTGQSRCRRPKLAVSHSQNRQNGEAGEHQEEI